MFRNMNKTGIQYDDLGPLTQAHALERKAERSLKLERYDESKNFYCDAASIISDMLECAKKRKWSKYAIESLAAQKTMLDKQKYIVEVRRKQRDNFPKDEVNKSSHELFQTIGNFSTMSLESYDSAEYLQLSTEMNNTISYRNDDVVRRMGLFIRQQQNEILALSAKIRQKDNENLELLKKIALLEKKVSQRNLPKHD